MSSSIPQAQWRPSPLLAQQDHPLFREAAIKSHSFTIPAGTSRRISEFDATHAGVYSILITDTANTSAVNSAYGLFRLDNSGTVTFIQDAGGHFSGTFGDPDKLSVAVDTGGTYLSNQFTDTGPVTCSLVFLYRA